MSESDCMTPERLQEIAHLHALTRHEHAPEIGYRMLVVAAVPELLTEVERLRDERDDAEDKVHRLRDELDHATAHDGDHLSKASRAMVDTVVVERDALRGKVMELEAEVARLKIANGSLVPNAMLVATEIGCLLAERDGARRERDQARASVLSRDRVMEMVRAAFAEHAERSGDDFPQRAIEDVVVRAGIALAPKPDGGA